MEEALELLWRVVQHACLTPDHDYFDYGVIAYHRALEYLADHGRLKRMPHGRYADIK